MHGKIRKPPIFDKALLDATKPRKRDLSPRSQALKQVDTLFRSASSRFPKSVWEDENDDDFLALDSSPSPFDNASKPKAREKEATAAEASQDVPILSTETPATSQAVPRRGKRKSSRTQNQPRETTLSRIRNPETARQAIVASKGKSNGTDHTTGKGRKIPQAKKTAPVGGQIFKGTKTKTTRKCKPGSK